MSQLSQRTIITVIFFRMAQIIAGTFALDPAMLYSIRYPNGVTAVLPPPYRPSSVHWSN